jgi:ABC-type transport system involved in cytochrome c biogenesis permease subunit
LSSGWKKILKPLASLYLTVALLLASMLLVYAGTAVQKQMSAQDVQRAFFHSWFVRVPFDPFFRPFANADSTSWMTHLSMLGIQLHGFWILGGYTLILLLLLNLIAAHSVRFKLTWKRSGIIAIHLGLIVMLFGEVFASLFSVEGQMMIDLNQTMSYTYDSHHAELAVIDPSPSDHDDVTVFDSSLLKPGAVLRAPSLPFVITLDNYFPNASLAGPMQEVPGAVAKATAGNNQRLQIVPERRAVGTDSEEDRPAAFATIAPSGGGPAATYLFTLWDNPGFNRENVSPYFKSKMVTGGPQTIAMDGKTYQISLRFKRQYKPYQVTLQKFTHDVHAGTDTPSNFASYIRLVDPARNVDRNVKIWMNHPLTYPSLRGETFYQQAFQPGDHTSILQVTHNPAWPLPYVGLALGFLGMLFHFGMNLKAFLRRQATARETAYASTAPARAKGKPYTPVHTPSPIGMPVLTTYTLQPKSRLGGWLAAVLGAAVCAAFFGYVMAAPVAPENGFDLATFSRLPVSFGGRVMPLDTLARIGLKVVSTRETLPDPADKDKSHPAIRWLADTMSDAPASLNYKVILIDAPDVRSQLGLDANEKYFSLGDLLARKEIVQKQMDLAIQVPDKQRDDYQRHIVDLAQHVEQYLELRQVGKLLVVPPASEADGKWKPLETTRGTLAPDGRPFANVLQNYGEDKPRDFNSTVAAYHSALEKQLPSTMTNVNYEVFFNHADPFFWCIWFYMFLVFVPACLSWMTWRGFFWPLAMGAMVVIASYHTFGIASRVYLTGWGPVTNLYSAAAFIGWAVVLFSIGLELIYRNGVGAAAGAIVGFTSLILAHFLGLDGDMMKPLQAVLMTKFWLWTHVPCVVLGYASTILAATLAIAYVMLGLFTPLIDEPSGKALSRMVYAITCFAILFSFVGTILGGIWADFSWGRFWGWDPKENGAILIVLWNAIILHARWGGLVKQRGMMVLAILGIIVTSWSYFGTNLLGIGLHSYGFMEGASGRLQLVWLGTAILAGIGLIPLRYWRSFVRPVADIDGRAFAVVTPAAPVNN